MSLEDELKAPKETRDYLKKDVRVIVDKVRTFKSKLSSEHSVQSIVHKAIYKKLGKFGTWQ